MNVTPRSIAVRMMRILSFASFTFPICDPPNPMTETLSPVLPKVRYIILAPAPESPPAPAKDMPAAMPKISRRLQIIPWPIR